MFGLVAFILPKGKWETISSGEKVGSLKIDPSELRDLENHPYVLYLFAFSEMLRYLTSIGYVDTLLRDVSKGVGVILTGDENGEQVSAKIVYDKERPDLPCCDINTGKEIIIMGPSADELLGD